MRRPDREPVELAPLPVRGVLPERVRELLPGRDHGLAKDLVAPLLRRMEPSVQAVLERVEGGVDTLGSLELGVGAED